MLYSILVGNSLLSSKYELLKYFVLYSEFCGVVLSHVVSYCVMSCNILSCHARLCYVMLCYVMLYGIQPQCSAFLFCHKGNYEVSYEVKI